MCALHISTDLLLGEYKLLYFSSNLTGFPARTKTFVSVSEQ